MGEHYAQDAVYYHEVFQSLRKKNEYSTGTKLTIDNENLFCSHRLLKTSIQKKLSILDKRLN